MFERVSVSDVETVVFLMSRMHEVDPWDQPFDANVVRRSVAELVRNSIFGLAYLAFDGERPIGYLIVCFDFSFEYGGKCSWIDELFIEEHYRGKGIGSQFLDLAEEISHEHGARALHLEVNHGNRAIELYRRRHFVDHHRYLMTKT